MKKLAAIIKASNNVGIGSSKHREKKRSYHSAKRQAAGGSGVVVAWHNGENISVSAPLVKHHENDGNSQHMAWRK